jgi:hypothetical protein
VALKVRFQFGSYARLVLLVFVAMKASDLAPPSSGSSTAIRKTAELRRWPGSAGPSWHATRRWRRIGLSNRDFFVIVTLCGFCCLRPRRFPLQRMLNMLGNHRWLDSCRATLAIAPAWP